MKSTSTIHALPPDFRKALAGAPKARAVWEDITPLARNEWICWVTSGKKAETRGIRIKKGISKLGSGMRRPCCWIGCIHRTDKAVSPSVRGVLARRGKKPSSKAGV